MYAMDSLIKELTKVNCSRELYISTPSIFVDAAYPKSVVCLAWNTVAKNLH